MKLASELSKVATGRTLYILDEPTTGLHFADIEKLLETLQRLVDAGNTMLVIEHNLDVIKQADWIVDLGPEGGEAGGEIVAVGTPEQVAEVEGSFTGDVPPARAARDGRRRRRLEHGLRLRDAGDELARVVVQLGVDDDRARWPVCSGRAITASHVAAAHRAEEVRLRLDRRRPGGARRGRLRNAQKPPTLSASPISAPPCRTPPAVHLSALHASRARTSCGEAETISIPRNAVNGAAAATCAVSSGSTASTRGEATLPGVSSEAAPSAVRGRAQLVAARAGGARRAARGVRLAARRLAARRSKARKEPITAIVGLAGIAGVLGHAGRAARSSTTRRCPSSLIPVWAFFGGAVYALALYWLGGGLLFGAARRLGGLGNCRRARQTLALATAPLALSLVTLWPVRIAVYGQ